MEPPHDAKGAARRSSQRLKRGAATPTRHSPALLGSGPLIGLANLSSNHAANRRDRAMLPHRHAGVEPATRSLIAASVLVFIIVLPAAVEGR